MSNSEIIKYNPEELINHHYSQISKQNGILVYQKLLLNVLTFVIKFTMILIFFSNEMVQKMYILISVNNLGCVFKISTLDNGNATERRLFVSFFDPYPHVALTIFEPYIL